MKQVRCAIYTRKSSDEGLEQAFNSLDAQREACAAYILSQASEGWSALPDIYDDGGLSGGTLERPALRRLLAEVAAGHVDIIVVYKVDRLTRSLFDFAKLVETFDKAGTSFVSVTQSFNTTTSMGRLTLNMLLSFAQFEREVTAERIRDKIAASKAKGMWMGGTPPLGYRPDGRSLAIVEEHAALIRHIVTRYLVLGNVSRLEAELAVQRITLPVRQRSNGSGTYGGGAFTRGQLYKILANPIYIGRIPHGEKSYAGRHPAILSKGEWDDVQAALAANRQGSRTRGRAATPSLLAGKMVDQLGEPFIASHACKAARRPGGGTTRYRYYVSRALHQGQADSGSRLPALEVETAVCEAIAKAFDDPVALAGCIHGRLTPANTRSLIGRAEEVAKALRQRHRATASVLIAKVRLLTGTIEIDCPSSAFAEMLHVGLDDDAPATITVSAGATLTRTGRTMRLVQDNGTVAGAAANPSLVKLLVKARRWWKLLRAGDLDVTTLAAREGVQPSYVTRILRLAFLSPTIIDAALKGKLRADIDVGSLTLAGPLPACWREQALLFLPAATNVR